MASYNCPWWKLKHEINNLNNVINYIYTLETQQKLKYLKQWYYEAGRKLSKLLAKRLCKQQADNTIWKISILQTTFVEGVTDMEDIP